jgi:hypothetical protein
MVTEQDAMGAPAVEPLRTPGARGEQKPDITPEESAFKELIAVPSYQDRLVQETKKIAQQYGLQDFSEASGIAEKALLPSLQETVAIKKGIREVANKAPDAITIADQLLGALDSGKLEWTGGPLSKLEAGRRSFQGYYLNDTESLGEAQAAELLDKTKAGIIAIMKVPGLGNMTEFESKIFTDALASIDAGKGVNKHVVQLLKEKFKRIQDKNDFVVHATETLGKSGGVANSLWNLYDRTNPIFRRDKEGKIITAPDSGTPVVYRPAQSWRKFLKEGPATAAPTVMPGESTFEAFLERMKREGRVKE